MTRMLVFLLALLLAPVAALAQSGTPIQQMTGSTSTGAPTFGVISSGNPLYIQGTISPGAVAVTPTDKGGTITSGGTAQALAASNTSRKLLVVQNPCTATGQGIATAESLFVAVSGTATVNGAGNFAELAPCGSATISLNGQVITAAVSVIAATTSHRWLATEAQ